MDLTRYTRRPAHEVRIGGVVIGGNQPIAVQSMTNTSTNDTAGSVAQIERIDRAAAKLSASRPRGVARAKT